MAAPGIKVSRNRTVTVADVLPFMPPIGIWWPRSGGRHVGVLGDYSLVLGPVSCVEMTWSEADSWARSLRIGSLADFVLPSVIELRYMIRALPSCFAVRRLWSSETVLDVPQDAWIYDVLTDDAEGWGRHFKLYAAAIRRETIWRNP